MTKEAAKTFLLLVDGDLDHNEETKRALNNEGFEVLAVMTAAEAWAALRRRTPAAVLVGQSLPDARGLAVLGDEDLKQSRALVYYLVDDAPVAEVVEAIRRGATDVAEKPVIAPIFGRLLREALAARREAPEKDAGGASPDDLSRPPIIGKSPAIRAVLDALKLVVQAPKATVLIEGESGTGKELIARAVHFDSPRRDGPFLAVNCATLNENLLEAELFGYEKGSFTGALASGKKGLFEAAAGGTLFLDEIGELASGMQAKLLRVIQEGAFKRVGGVQDIRVDVRIIAATNRDLRKEVKDGRFRADLYYRLNVVPVRVPSLRDRKDDIPDLCRFFLEKFAADLEKRIDGVSSRALEKLTGYDWPGNIRELRNICEYAAIVCDGPVIEARHLTIPETVAKEKADDRRPSDSTDLPPAEAGARDLSLRAMESELIRTVLNETRYNISRAAQTLGINRSTLYNKMRDLGMYPQQRSKTRQSV